MKLKTYQAYTMAEVLQQIRKDLGANAVIVHSRTFKRSGMFRWFKRTVYEVTASTKQTDSKAREQQKPSRNGSPQRRRSTSAHPQTDEAAKARFLLEELSRARSQQKQGGNDAPPPSGHPVAPPSPPAQQPIEQRTEQTLFNLTSHDAAAQTSRPRSHTTIPTPTPTGNGKPYTPPVARRYVIRDDEPARTPAPKQETRTPPPHDTPPTRIQSTASIRPTARTEPADAARLSNELAAVRQMVSQVLVRQSGAAQPGMPAELLKYYMTLIESEVSQDIADEICGKVRDELGSARLDSEEDVRGAVLHHLTAYIPVADDSDNPARARHDGRPLTIALVGPTGVGKTTTIAKLAASYHLRKHLTVGLITTDTYRIAAVDQLRTYANIIGIPLKVALTPTEIAAACHDLRQCDVILIDTAGRSPNDREKIDEIRRFIKAADPHETHLVLSGTSGESTLIKTVERFSDVSADRIIFTKLDEAVSFGVLVNVVRRVGKQLSYVTTGQDVPDNIHAGHPERLARLIVGECQPTEME
ncbi:MAG: flagellar biosynthesis protein FlhF [Planctomycetes bacterium]|nr:flagellar biosynthesis protein FlhF [Planctomycetota bacterium]NOG53573.1 flagellar biosynthesis protein FlhF [Planctomycetota bacterium]